MRTKLWHGKMLASFSLIPVTVFLCVTTAFNTDVHTVRIISASGHQIGSVFEGLRAPRHTPSTVARAKEPTVPDALEQKSNRARVRPVSDIRRSPYRLKNVQGDCGSCVGHYMEQVERFCSIYCNVQWTQESGDDYDIGYEVCPLVPPCNCPNEYTCVNTGIK